MDSRGHGRSHQHGPFGVDDYAADVRAVIEKLSLEHVHLIGASLGGSIACAVAAQLPEQVRSLTAFGASLEPAEPEVLDALRRWREQVEVEGLFDDFLRQEIQHGLPERVAADARSQIGFDSRAPALIHEITYRAFAEDARHHAAKVRCPALLLTGEHDESCPPGAGARTAEALRGHFEILGGLGHFPMMQAPKNMAARLMQFIEGATPR
jgi:pimeloyl-ACP methyl ester carboxylesterase